MLDLGAIAPSAARAISTRREASAPTPEATVEISYNPQDKLTMGTAPTTITTDAATALSTPRVEFKSSPPAPRAGKFVYSDNDNRIHSALPFASVAKTVEVFEKALGKPIKWSFNRPKIRLVPDGGEMLNAYYKPYDGTLNFFHAKDPKTMTKLFSGDSGEVTAHETGHAILDSLRPGYLQAYGYETRAFHESFGDVVSIIMNLRDERTLDKLVDQTNGDLSKQNLVAAVGEHIGRAINNTAGENVTGGDWVRTAINRFKWAKPSSLPESGGPNHLGREEHSLSRLWTGAVYDVLKGIVNRNTAAGQSPKDALRAAGDELLKINVNLFKTAPMGDFGFKDMAQACIKADQTYNAGKNVSLMTTVFTTRKIIGKTEAETTAPTTRAIVSEGAADAPEGTRNIRVTLRGEGFGMFEGAVVETPVDTDGSLAMNDEAGARLHVTMKSHIAAGRIKYTEPGQRVTDKDLFNADGKPYIGIVRWFDGQMRIEPVRIVR